MKVKIRKPNNEGITEEGIPKDFADVMQYFNMGLIKNAYPFIPRKIPITLEEIKDRWMPSLDKNINCVAEHKGRIIGMVTIFYDLDSTAYEHATERDTGEIALTVNPDYNHQIIGKEIIGFMINELKRTNRRAILHTDINFSGEISMMKELSYTGKLINNFKRYRKAGLSEIVVEYQLP